VSVITPHVRPDLPELADDEFHSMVLTDTTTIQGKAFNDPATDKDFTVFELRLQSGAPEALSLWCSQTLGMNVKNNVVSKLRQVLNALANRPETDTIVAFDSDLHHWSYKDGTTHQLRPGMRLEIRGCNVTTVDGVHRFNVDRIRPVRRAEPRVAIDDVPFGGDQ
jgi:hypothetical protein